MFCLDSLGPMPSSIALILIYSVASQGFFYLNSFVMYNIKIPCIGHFKDSHPLKLYIYIYTYHLGIFGIDLCSLLLFKNYGDFMSSSMTLDVSCNL